METFQAVNFGMIWFGLAPIVGAVIGAFIYHVAISRGVRIGEDREERKKLPRPEKTT